jgi:hypothetical protein
VYKDPKRKEDLLDRMTRMDFNGDLRTLGNDVQLSRLKAHVLQLFFPQTGKRFNLTVHKPRGPRKAKITAKPKAPAKVVIAGETRRVRARKSRQRPVH